MSRSTMLSREHQGPRAVLNALDRLATGYGSDCDRVRQDLSIAESQLRDYQARLGKPFTLEAYLTELTGLRDQLKAGLSASNHDSDNEKGPSTSDLAEKIKSLKAANSIEATLQRNRQKHSTAEEPITARIRRRQDSNHAPDHTAEQGTAPESIVTPAQDSSGNALTTFRERILAERLQKTDGRSPS